MSAAPLGRPRGARFTAEDVRHIRASVAAGVSKHSLSRTFGCAWTTIHLIAQGLTHKGVEPGEDEPAETLEQRVARLEQAVAALLLRGAR